MHCDRDYCGRIPAFEALQWFARKWREATVRPLSLLSPIFGDNMVLQRAKMNTIWGWSDPGDKVRVQIANKAAYGIAGPTGAGK